MARQWCLRTMVGLAALGLLCGSGLAQEGGGRQERYAKMRGLRKEIREIDEQLKPIVEQILGGDEVLADLARQLQEARQDGMRNERELRAEAFRVLAEAQPDLAETIELIQELQQKMGGLWQEIREGGEGAEEARKRMREAQQESRELMRTIDGPLRKTMTENEELRAARQALDESRKSSRETVQEYEQKLAAAILQTSPESKDLVERRKALQEQFAALMKPQPRGRALSEEQRKKMGEIRERMRALEKQLMPARRKIYGEDPEVKELSKRLQELVTQKMLQAEPKLSDAIKEHQELQQEMRKVWQQSAPKKEGQE